MVAVYVRRHKLSFHLCVASWSRGYLWRARFVTSCLDWWSARAKNRLSGVLHFAQFGTGGSTGESGSKQSSIKMNTDAELSLAVAV